MSLLVEKFWDTFESPPPPPLKVPPPHPTSNKKKNFHKHLKTSGCLNLYVSILKAKFFRNFSLTCFVFATRSTKVKVQPNNNVTVLTNSKTFKTVISLSSLVYFIRKYTVILVTWVCFQVLKKQKKKTKKKKKQVLWGCYFECSNVKSCECSNVR